MARLSGRHPAAALGAVAARLHAFLHAADLLAALRAFLTDLRALAAGVLVVVRADQHEVGRRLADLGAGHHNPEVPWFDVLATLLQAVVHRRPEANAVAAQAFLDAGAYRMELGDEVRRRWPGMSIILTTGNSQVLANGDARDFELLHKPYSAENLARVLRSVD
jgi:hypothetical protein